MRYHPTRATIKVGVLFCGGLLFGAASGALAGGYATDPYAGLDLMARSLALVTENYVRPVESDDLVDDAMRGMLSGLDNHSRWMDRDEYATLRKDTRATGHQVGIRLERVDNRVLLSRVLNGSPAAVQGLKVGDELVSIDGEKVRDTPLPSLMSRLEGERGSTVALGILRDSWDDPRRIPVRRDVVDEINVESITHEGVLYLRIVQFRAEVASELRRAFEMASRTERPRALLVDIRDNPGGLLDEAVAVTDLFLREGILVSTKSRVEGERTYRASPEGFPPELPVFLLVNGRSASASEILAGALQDTGRAVLIGENTFGKGTVQSVYENRDGSALKLTTGEYFTPSGAPVAPSAGRSPDVTVEMGRTEDPAEKLMAEIEDLELTSSSQKRLRSIIEQLPRGGSKRHAIPWDAPFETRMSQDPQLAKAVELALANQ